MNEHCTGKKIIMVDTRGRESALEMDRNYCVKRGLGVMKDFDISATQRFVSTNYFYLERFPPFV